jgi:hypothetical protein
MSVTQQQNRPGIESLEGLGVTDVVAAPVADAGDKPINFSCSILGFDRVLPGSEIKVPTTTCINGHRECDIHISLFAEQQARNTIFIWLIL